MSVGTRRPEVSSRGEADSAGGMRTAFLRSALSNPVGGTICGLVPARCTEGTACQHPECKAVLRVAAARLQVGVPPRPLPGVGPSGCVARGAAGRSCWCCLRVLPSMGWQPVQSPGVARQFRRRPCRGTCHLAYGLHVCSVSSIAGPSSGVPDRASCLHSEGVVGLRPPCPPVRQGCHCRQQNAEWARLRPAGIGYRTHSVGMWREIFRGGHPAAPRTLKLHCVVWPVRWAPGMKQERGSPRRLALSPAGLPVVFHVKH